MVRISSRHLSTSPFPHGGPDELTVSLMDGDEYRVFARSDARYLSTEVAGGFTGRVVGLETGSAPSLISRVELRPR